MILDSMLGSQPLLMLAASALVASGYGFWRLARGCVHGVRGWWSQR
jgi:hypothetical protein